MLPITRALALAAAMAWLPAHAVNKCTMPDGRVVYSDALCPGTTKQAQTLSTEPKPTPALATPRPPDRPPAPAGRPSAAPTAPQPAQAQALQIPPPLRIVFSGLPNSDVNLAAATMEKIRVLGRDCEWALKVDPSKIQACVDFLAKVQPRGELDQINARVSQVLRHEPDAARESAADLRKLEARTDEVLRYKELAVARFNLAAR